MEFYKEWDNGFVVVVDLGRTDRRCPPVAKFKYEHHAQAFKYFAGPKMSLNKIQRLIKEYDPNVLYALDYDKYLRRIDETETD